MSERLLHTWAGGDTWERCTHCGTFRAPNPTTTERPYERQECPVRLRTALDDERAAIVAWHRGEAERAGDSSVIAADEHHYSADAIEAGVHRLPNPESR